MVRPSVFLLVAQVISCNSLRLFKTKKESDHGIPKIIHQTWKTTNLPEVFQKWSQTWKDCLPDWEYRLHTDDDNREFIATHFPHLLGMYDGYRRPIQRVDAVRYALLAVEGGIYVDLDIECLRDPSPLFAGLANSSAMLACEGCKWVSNAFMGAGVAPNPFFERVVNSLPAHAHKKDVLRATGPHFMTNVVSANEGLNTRDWGTSSTSLTRYAQGKNGTDFLLVDDSAVLALSWSDQNAKTACLSREVCQQRFPNAYSVSHWAASWTGGPALPNLTKIATTASKSKATLCGCLVHSFSMKSDLECANELRSAASMRELLNLYLESCD